jgi:palmitoyltransferase
MPSIPTGPSNPGLQVLAVPAVACLVAFLGYSSQWLFHTSPGLEPGRPSTAETAIFNVLLACLWWTYFRACTVDPGRYVFLEGKHLPKPKPDTDAAVMRWCKKCRLPKPPRAHHCRVCARCVPKMDHHCPWTANCVSLQTFPHFARFLLYTNLSLWALARLLFQRFHALWLGRHLPAYLGPTTGQLIHLTLLALVCSATCFALAIMLFTSAKAFVLNTTMIEGWEAERHEAVVERGSSGDSSFWSDDADIPIEPVEFPYDLGFFDNMAQAMGTRNVLAWLWPFSGGPILSKDGKGIGWEWEENGFNPREGMWPPPDPEKLRRARTGWPGAKAGGGDDKKWGTPEEEKAAFRARQAQDWRRFKGQESGIVGELDEDEDDAVWENPDYDYLEENADAERSWTNADGDRLRDYGVDEDAEEDDLINVQAFEQQDEDVPLGELLRRRKAAKATTDGE